MQKKRWRASDETVKPVIAALKKEQGELTVQAYATQIGTTARCLYDLYNGFASPNDEILDHLGLEKKVTVEYIPRRWR